MCIVLGLRVMNSMRYVNYITKNYIHRISMTRVIEADISAAVVLISMGALLGRTTPIQLLLMAIIEIVVYAANEYLQLELLKVYVIRIFNHNYFIDR